MTSSLSGKVVNITEANYLADYKLKLTFDDGHWTVVDFEPFLQDSRHPDIRKYLNIDRFKQFEIKHGNLNWNEYDLCFPIADLYEGSIHHQPTYRILNESKLSLCREKTAQYETEKSKGEE